MSTINPELVLSEKKMKVAARRLNDTLVKAGVESSLNYSQSLNALSKTIFGIPYEEVLATLLTEKGSNKASESLSSVYLVRVGGNTLLVVDGQYESATNPGTDLEISENALTVMAESMASRKGVSVQNYVMPEAISNLEVDEDGAYVDIMREMGFFRPEGSLFYALYDADIVEINNMSIMHAAFMEEGAFDEDGVSKSAVVWDPVCADVGGIEDYELIFTFGDLCDAKKKEGRWSVYSSILKEWMTISLFKSV